MPARWSTLGALALAAAATGCDAEAWLRARQARAFREVGAAEARRLVTGEDGLLLQDAASAGSTGWVTPARVLAAEGPLPEELVATQRPLVVVAGDDATARRLAARLVRAGAGSVAVVRGGVAAWQRHAGRPDPEPAAVL